MFRERERMLQAEAALRVLSGNFPTDMRIPPLKIKIPLGSSPLRSRPMSLS